MIKIDSTKCVACGACVNDCIVKVLKQTASRTVPYVPEGDEKYCINCQHCLAVCPKGAVVCNDVAPEECAEIGRKPSDEEMMNLIRSRRSIRRYKNENLDAETLDKLKNSLAWSPTGCNDHKLFFTLIDDKNEMTSFKNEMSKVLRFLIKSGIMRLIYPNYKRYLGDIFNGEDVVFRDAPHMIVACTPVKAPCKEADPWIALTSFDFYAQTLNIGTCYCGFAVYAFKWIPKLKKRLKMPSGYKVGAVMLFGKPQVEYARCTKPENCRFS